MSSLRNRVGELFISGFRSEDASEAIINQIRGSSLGGVILFAENCIDHKRLQDAIAKFQASSDRQLIVAIDQEGGRVCRLKGSPVEYLAAGVYGLNAEESIEALEVALSRYRKDFNLAAEYMAEIGINLLLAPVCDLHPADTLPDDATALRSRTFSASPKVVGAFAKATVELSHKHNLLCCLKHAPGLGSVVADPHVVLGASSLKIDEFKSKDLIPFRMGCEAGADMIMTSHFLIPEFDALPVTYSEKIIEALVRSELSEEAVLITDDLDMGALRDIGEADNVFPNILPKVSSNVFSKAFNAGHDILLARSNDTIVKGIEDLQAGLSSGAVSELRVAQALSRVDCLRSKLGQAV